MAEAESPASWSASEARFGSPYGDEFEAEMGFEPPLRLAERSRGAEASGLRIKYFEPLSPVAAVRDRHLRLADLALLPPTQAGDDSVGFAGAPVRFGLREPAALQEAIPWLRAQHRRLLSEDSTGERGVWTCAQALADARRLAGGVNDQTLTPAGSFSPSAGHRSPRRESGEPSRAASPHKTAPGW